MRSINCGCKSQVDVNEMTYIETPRDDTVGGNIFPFMVTSTNSSISSSLDESDDDVVAAALVTDVDAGVTVREADCFGLRPFRKTSVEEANT